MKNFSNAIKEINLFGILFFILFVFFIVFFIEDILNYDSFELFFILIAIYIFYMSRKSLKTIPRDINSIFSKISFLNIFFIVLFNLIFSYAMLIISDSINFFYGFSIFRDIFSLFLIAPICEEILFRGILLPKLNYFLPLPLAILISSLIFGSLHSFGGIISAVVFGICMAVLFVKTNNIFVPILSHFLFNLFVLLFSYFDPNDLILSNILFNIILIVLGLFSLYLIYKSVSTEFKKINRGDYNF